MHKETNDDAKPTRWIILIATIVLLASLGLLWQKRREGDSRSQATLLKATKLPSRSASNSSTTSVTGTTGTTGTTGEGPTSNSSPAAQVAFDAFKAAFLARRNAPQYQMVRKKINEKGQYTIVETVSHLITENGDVFDRIDHDLVPFSDNLKTKPQHTSYLSNDKGYFAEVNGDTFLMTDQRNPFLEEDALAEMLASSAPSAEILRSLDYREDSFEGHPVRVVSISLRKLFGTQAVSSRNPDAIEIYIDQETGMYTGMIGFDSERAPIASNVASTVTLSPAFTARTFVPPAPGTYSVIRTRTEATKIERMLRNLPPDENAPGK